MTPLQVVSTVGGTTPTSITVASPTSNAVANAAIVTLYTPGTVNLSGGYAAGYTDYITITPPAVLPVVGQPVTFGTNSTDIYTIADTQSSGTSISLDRPLNTAIANAATVNLGPAGNYNFVFHRNALALVSRPLALPRAGMGALAANVTYNNLSMRVVMTYQGINQGTLVTIDLLMGIAIFEKLAGVLLAG
jgi:hypothetical protein